MLKAGVIGVGNMGARHARVYASLPGRCSLVGVYDVDARKAAEVAGRYGARSFNNPEELVREVDVVTVASPTANHLSYALLALKHGVDLLIEKPVTLTPQEAHKLERFVVRLPQRPIIQVGHIEHFNPAVREVRHFLQDEEILALEVQRLSPFDPRITDADVVQDLMIHDIHVVLSVVGSPLTVVQAAGRGVRSDGKVDYAVANLVFQNGVIATLFASRTTEERVRRLAVSTLNAYATVDYLQRTLNICRRTKLSEDTHGSRAYRQESVIERVYVPTEEPLTAEIEDFLRAVEERREPQVPLRVGVQCLEVAELVRERIHETALQTKAAGVVVA